MYNFAAECIPKFDEEKWAISKSITARIIVQ